MIKILHCIYNIDTASVEATFSDGSVLSIYSPAVDDEIIISLKLTNFLYFVSISNNELSSKFFILKVKCLKLMERLTVDVNE